ncbi:MAG: TonB-dependent receptor, partial [Pedobacter sp.]|nr:TonB-dependent receptor [Pedobacter sp.]
MRCSMIVIVAQLTFMSMLLANNVKSQDLDRKISLHLAHVTVAEGLSIIGKQSNIKFSLREQSMKSVKKSVTLVSTEITVREAINRLLANTGLQYKLVEGYIVVDAKPIPIVITGTVTDNKTKETLIGVSVRIKATGGAVSTDANGKFRIVVPEGGAVLVISYMGYETREIKVDGTKEINIGLNSSSMQLGEVTVQARRKTNTESAVLDERKKSSTVQDAISAVQIERTASITTTQALQRVSGVTVTDDKYVAIRGLGDRSV